MSYFSTFSFCLIYIFSNIQINFALASQNVSTISESQYIRNGDDEDPVHLITGGYRPAKHTLAKYVVSIRTRNPLNYRYNKYFGSTHFCGGAILSPKLILTAAHCLKKNGRRLRPWSLEVVTSTPKRLVRTTHTRIHEVRKVIVDGKYDSYSFYFDIGLLQLNDEIDLDGTYAQAIPLPRVLPIVGTACTTLGWGRLYWDGPYANEIVYANLTIMNSSYCRRWFPIFTDGQICAFDPNDILKNACVGDSGGPVICDGSVTALVSYGYKCGNGLPGVYTDVYAYLDWINRSKSGKLGASLWILQFLNLLWTRIISC